MMKMKLFLGLCAVMLTIGLYAQKPLVVAFWSEPTVNEADGRVASLLWEYFKSELATHSGLKVASSTLMTDIREKLQPVPAGPLTEAQIRDICKKASADILCSAYLTHNKDKFDITMKIYDKDGKLKGTVNESFSVVRESDLITLRLARAAAIQIRGESPVDNINLEREKRLLEELKKAEAEEKAKQEVKN